ncbi:MAG: hypothetical protein DCC75_14260, partial [Proteobacteria bacterium]
SISEHDLGYQPRLGFDAVRRAIAAHESRFAPRSYGLDSVALTYGVLGGFQQVVELLAGSSNQAEFILPLPCYADLVRDIDRVGVPVTFLTSRTNNFMPTLEEIASRITNRTAAIVITQPNNPTGKYLNRDTLSGLIELAEQNQIYLIIDEVGDNFYSFSRRRYDIEQSNPVISLENYRLQYPANLISPFVVRLRGFSKEFGLAGFRVGYVLGSPAVVQRMAENVAGNPPVVMNKAILKLLEGSEQTSSTLKANLVTVLNEKRWIIETLASSPHVIDMIEPEGSYNILCRVNSPAGSMEFFRRLLEAEKVSIYPGCAFGLNDEECWIRITYANEHGRNIQAVGRLLKFLAEQGSSAHRSGSTGGESSAVMVA